MSRYPVICDRCGFRFWNTQVRKEWTGLMVCRGHGTNDCYDHRHPQDFARGKVDKQRVANPRPEPEPNFLSVNEVNPDDL